MKRFKPCKEVRKSIKGNENIVDIDHMPSNSCYLALTEIFLVTVITNTSQKAKEPKGTIFSLKIFLQKRISCSAEVEEF